MMRAVSPENLPYEFEVALVARLTPAQFVEAFPLSFDTIDPLASAEPSVGSVVQMKSGRRAAVTYGRETGTLTVETPATADAPIALRDLLNEAAIDENVIEWIRPDIVAAWTAAVPVNG